MAAREFWKICRKLANDYRIDVLRKVMTSPDRNGLPVGQIAGAVGLEQSATGLCLGQLQGDCGLVVCARAGRRGLYRAEPDASDPKAAALFPPLRDFFRRETPYWAFANGARPPAPPFMSVLPALSNATRVRLIGHIRAERRTDRAMAAEATGISASNLRRHLLCIAGCGLVVQDGLAILWREPSNPLSRLFIDLSLA